MKPLHDVKIDCYDNGQGIIIKRLKDRKVIGAKVFLKGQEQESIEWMNKTIEDSLKEMGKK